MKLNWLLVCCLMLFVQFASAQGMTPNYRGDSSFTSVDNVPNCLGTTVCWHALSGSGGLNAAKIYSGNGHVLAIDASGLGYSYNDYPTNTWTAHPEWGTVYEVQYAGDGNLYGMTGSCAGTGHYISKWTGSTWQTVATCYQASFSPAADGTDMMLAFDVNGYLWGATGYGTSGFTRYPMPNGLTAISVAAISGVQQTYVLVLSDFSIWKFGAGAWYQFPNTALQVTADASGTVYMRGGQSYINRWNGASWDKLAGGGKTFLANGGTWQIFAIGALVGGNTVYRLPDVTVRHSRTLSGNTSCSPNCGTAMHVGHVTAGWGSAYGTQVNSSSVTPPTNINISSNADVVDPFTCLEMPGTSACNSSGGENVGCTQVGNIFQSSVPALNLKFEFAHARAKVTAPPVWSWTKLSYQYNSLADYCQTVPNDLSITAGDHLGLWDGHAVAVDVAPIMFSLTGGAPWHRLAGSNITGAFPTSFDTDPGPRIHCDYNP